MGRQAHTGNPGTGGIDSVIGDGVVMVQTTATAALMDACAWITFHSTRAPRTLYACR